MVTTLGINGVDGVFHDSSASIVQDGRVLASVEEERFNRKKHSNGIPYQAIDYCLRVAASRLEEVDHIGYYLDPQVMRTTFYTDIIRRFGCSPRRLNYFERAVDRIGSVKRDLIKRYCPGQDVSFSFVNHHVAHAASAYYLSGFDSSAILTIDGAGDRETCVLFHGEGSRISKVEDVLVYPDSLGFIYTVIADHLGLGWIEGPGKLMGLAGYGKPNLSIFEGVVQLRDDARRPIEIDLSFFNYFVAGSGLSKEGLRRFGPRRKAGKLFNQEQCDLAASTQDMLERSLLHISSFIPELLPGVPSLCLAGGVALNVGTNRKIVESGLFQNVFITPPAYDGGTSLGCALWLASQATGIAKFAFEVYCGPDIEHDYSIESDLLRFDKRINFMKLDNSSLVERAAQLIQENKIVGWAQGRMECGPRALGNRSILANATDQNGKDNLNRRVKHRESFRPYSPSVIREECSNWFDISESPYMLLEANALPGKQKMIPAVVHVDGTSRVQTVTGRSNARFYQLLQAVYKKSGVPMVLNTSFNQHGEPIVNTPAQAVEMLLDTDMDALFIGNYFVTKTTRKGFRRRD